MSSVCIGSKGRSHPLSQCCRRGTGIRSALAPAAWPFWRHWTTRAAEEALTRNAPELAARYHEFTPALLREEVARTRARGYAVNEGRLQAGSWGVGVAVLGWHGRCEGALSVAAIESRLMPPRQEEVAALLQAEAQRLTERLAQPAGASDLHSPARREAAPVPRTAAAAGGKLRLQHQ